MGAEHLDSKKAAVIDGRDDPVFSHLLRAAGHGERTRCFARGARSLRGKVLRGQYQVRVRKHLHQANKARKTAALF
jgi:hypothetical protein